MDFDENGYWGHFDHKLDPKFRVSVPVAFRPEEQGEAMRLQFSKEQERKVVKVFTSAAFEDKFRQVREADLIPKKKQEIIGALRMSSKEVSINSQGKLSLPKDWALAIGLEAEGPVKLAARDGYFLICSEEAFEHIFEADLEIDDGGLGVI